MLEKEGVNMNIGKKIKIELERRGISQKELCDLIGVRESAMSKYLNSDKPLRTDIVSKIARALNINVYQLLGINEREGTTFDICKTALLARSGTSLSDEEKKELINLIFGHK